MRAYKLSIVQKIALAGIFIVLVAIFQKILAINYIPVVPFLRISFGGPALIIFSSILLGPWFGLLIGAASDLIGFFIFDPKISSPYPMFQITFIYALLGFLSYFIFKWFSQIKSEKKMFYLELGTFIAILIAITLYFALSDTIVLYNKPNAISLEMKIWIPIASLILLSALFVFIVLVDKSFKKKNLKVSVYKVSFCSFIIEVLVMLLFGSLMKWWGFLAFYPTPWISIFIIQLMVGFFNIPFNTVVISYMLLISDGLIKDRE